MLLLLLKKALARQVIRKTVCMKGGEKAQINGMGENNERGRGLLLPVTPPGPSKADKACMKRPPTNQGHCTVLPCTTLSGSSSPEMGSFPRPVGTVARDARDLQHANNVLDTPRH